MDVNLTTHTYIMLTLRMRGYIVRPLVFMAWRLIKHKGNFNYNSHRDFALYANRGYLLGNMFQCPDFIIKL
jgi:hypothetical protein